MALNALKSRLDNFVGDVFPQPTLPWDGQFWMIFNDSSLSLFCQVTLTCEGLLIYAFKEL